MQSTNDIITELTGLTLPSNNDSELSLKKQTEVPYFYFRATQRATNADMIANNTVSLDSLVQFSIENNLSITNTNNTSKKVVFLNSRISDISIKNKIESLRIKFVSGEASANTKKGFILQENGAYLLQENGFKIKL